MIAFSINFSAGLHDITSMSREMSLAELKDKYRKLSALEKARNGWEGEYDASSKQVLMINYISY